MTEYSLYYCLEFGVHFSVDFINDTDADGYNAIAELTSIFNDNRKKLEVLEKIKKMMQDQDEIIEF